MPSSPRAVSVEQAREVISGAPLQYVGVFKNADIADVCQKAAVLSLSAVQLHGSEDRAYVNALREALPRNVQIWKALSVSNALPARDYHHVDKYIFDNGQGGSGQRFDWSLLQGQPLDDVLLAGGLAADNCVRRRKSAVPVSILIQVWSHSRASKMLVFWPRFSDTARILRKNMTTLLNPYFGEFGGMYVPQILMPALNQLEEAFVSAQKILNFRRNSPIC